MATGGFRFSLERVLRLKCQLQKQARLEWAAAVQRLHQLQDEQEQRTRQVQEIAQQMQRSVERNRQRAYDWQASHEYCRQLEQQIQRLRQDIGAQREVCRDRQAACARLSTEVESLETLKQHAWQEHKQRQQRDQQHATDEHVLQRQWRQR